MTAAAASSNNSIPSDPELRKLVIIGSGPAAHTAAIYAARAQLSPLQFEGFMAAGVAAGGQLTTTTEVENYPGFPEGISGPELMERLRQQSIRFGAEIVTETVERVDLSRRPFLVTCGNGCRTVYAEALIIATGATATRLDIPGTGEGPDGYWQRGVSACAVCDGALPLFRNAPLLVVGGGDSAMEEAGFLSRFASRVFVVHRRDELRASKIMQARARANPKIEILYSHVVDRVNGDGRSMREAVLRDLHTGLTRTVPAAGLFFAVGHQPNSSFLGGQLQVDAQGYIATKPGSTQTSVAGVFAAGDVQDRRYRQAVTAAGSGCMAALDAEHYLIEATLSGGG